MTSRLSPAERSLNARYAINTRWARGEDGVAATAKARSTYRASFADKVDPDHRMSPEARKKAGERLYRAHMQRLSSKAIAARRRKAARRR